MSNDKPFMTIVTFSLLVIIIVGLQGSAVHRGVLATTSDFNNTTGSSDTQKNKNILLITNILAKNLENHIQKGAAILEITSKLPQVRNVSYAHLLNQTLDTLHGIPQYADIEKRQVAKNILSSNSDFQIVIFIMPSGDVYFAEPYSRQQVSTANNLAFRDYFKGVFRTNDIYLGDPSSSVSSGQMQSVIAIPVYSLRDNSTIVGVWAGCIDFNILNKELQALIISSSSDGNNTRVVYVGHNGQKVADSNANKSKTPESFGFRPIVVQCSFNLEIFRFNSATDPQG